MLRRLVAGLLAALLFLAQAFAPASAMFGVTGLAGFGVTSDAAPVLTYITTGSSSADQTTYNAIASCSAATDGLMIVGVAGTASASRTVSSLSIGGTNGTIHVNPSGDAGPSAIVSRAVTAGAQSINVTFSGGVSRAAVSCWLLTGYASATPDDTDGQNVNDANTSHSATLDLAANGIAVFVAVRNNSTAGGSSWSSATERSDVEIESNPTTFTSADKTTSSAIAGHTETVTWTTSGTRVTGMSAASWH